MYFCFFCSQVQIAFKMTRRKSVCLKWTLVLFLVLICPYVQTRPQDISSNSVKPEITTENLIRYRYNNYSVRFSNSKVPVVTNSVKKFSMVNFEPVSQTKNNNIRIFNSLTDPTNASKYSNRTSHQIKSVDIRDMSKNKNNIQRRLKPTIATNDKTRVPLINGDRHKGAIRKVITKWNDKTKFEDLNFSYDTSTSGEIGHTIGHSHEYTSTETTKDIPVSKKRPPSKYFTAVYKPQNEYSEEDQMYSSNVQILDKNPSQSTYMYTKRPSPTPEITNVGYPKPWHTSKTKKPNTQKPVQVTRPLNYNYHNSIQNHGGNYEVSTFQPASAYTEKIVIRPEEYSGSNYDCPTIYLTLNNTFQGQAKEACPDLNIAVNTNVVNKNNVIESEEEDDTDSLFPNIFSSPVDESESGDIAGNDYFGSPEQVQDESASVEGTELANYHAANAIQSESAEPGGLFSPSSPISALSKPGRPHKDDDDIFSSLVQFFRPVINVLGWLTSVNPLTIGLFPLILAPIGLLFAGSGLTALFTPWFLPLGREAPKIIHIYRPYWHWDDTIKTWHLHSFPENRKWKPSLPRSSDEEDIFSVKPSLVQKFKSWLHTITGTLKERYQNKTFASGVNRKNKRKKREIWAMRVK